MSDHVDLTALIRRLEAELEADFPGWLITREASGRWSARLPGWGELHGDNAPQLRERLRSTPRQRHMSTDDRRRLRPAGGRSLMRKRQMALTEHERQVLLAELAEIAAELDALQERTAQITARVARCSPIRLARPA